MARKLIVEIIGDASSLDRSLSRANRSLGRFGRESSRGFRGVVAGSGAFNSLGKSVAFASTTFLGGVGFAAAVKTSVEAASNLNEQMTKSKVVFGDAADAVIGWSQDTVNSMGLAQDQALETASSFGALLRPLGLTGQQAAEQSEKLTQLGADLASFYNTSVQDALDAIRSGLVGESEPLRRYAVLLSESRVQAEALRETGKKSATQLTQQDKVMARLALIFRDSAQASGDFQRTSQGTANQLRIFQANVRELEIGIGKALLPTVTRIVSAMNKWFQNTDNQKRVLDDVKQVAGLLTDVLGGLKRAFEVLNDVTGSTRRSLELLFGVFIAYKSLRLAGSLAETAANIGLIGTKAAAAEGEATALRTSLMSLSTLGPIGIAVAVTVTAFAVQPYVTRALNKFFEKIGVRDRPTPEATGPLGGRSRLVWRNGRLVWSGSGTPYQRGQERDPAGRVAGGTRATSQDPFATARGAFARLPDLAQEPPGAAPRRPRFTRAQLNQFFDAAISRTLSRAQYQSLSRQLVIYQQVATKLRARIAVTKDITRQLKLEDQLLEVLSQEKDVRQQIVANAIDALEFNVEKAGLTKTLSDDLAALLRERNFIQRRLRAAGHNRDLERSLLGVQQRIQDIREQQAEQRREAAQKRRERITARQFGILGFGPGGEPKVPSLPQLRRQLDAMKGLLAHAPPRIQREVARIRKVLAEAFVPPEIRSKIRELFNQYQQELKGGAEGVQRTLFRVTSQREFVARLGLDPETSARLRAFRESRGPGGLRHAGQQPAFAGAAAGGGGVTITGPVHIYGVQNIRQLENELTKRHSTRPKSRRGAR